jgi:hypothetical protein
MAANEFGKNVEDIIGSTERVTDNFKENAKNMATNVADTTTNAVSQATESVKRIIEPYTSSSGAIYGLILVIIVAAITSYALYVMVTGVLFKKTRVIVEGTKIPVLCNDKRRIPITSFSNSGNGQRRSYSFWIYINDMNKYSGLYKHVLHVGDDSIITNASPYIFLDKLENKLYVRMSTTTGRESLEDPITSVANITKAQLEKFMKQGIVIPYIPIQRWVHIVIVINENVNGGTVTSYVDGDMASMVASGQLSDTLGNEAINVANLNIDKKGDLYVGGSSYSTEGPGFSGLISKFTMYNYDLNQQDVYVEYNQGPIDGLLAKLGLGAYGVRSPIYRIV